MSTRLSVFGMGYVGCVSAACFAKEGHQVIGVDVNPTKVGIINGGHSPIVEEGIDELVGAMVGAGRLRATDSVTEAIEGSEVSLICVGTPSNKNGSLDLRYVERVSEQIGAVLAHKAAPHTVVIRSTVLPGTVEDLVVPALERSSGKRVADGEIHVCMNPEFLRESTSIKDFYDPPFTLIGGTSAEGVERVAALYAGIEAPLYRTDIKVAEMVKYICNCFHGLKVSFANEVGNVAKQLGVDSHQVMEIFCQDTKLNLSPYYLKPGFAFGGSCLPKDIRGAQFLARDLDVETPVLNSILPSNDRQVQLAAERILAKGNRRIGILGMSFKAGTDDLRESPMVTLIEHLIGRGMELAIYDRNVSKAQVMGANKEYIEGEIPHIWSLMRDDIDEVVAHGDTIVVAHKNREFEEALARTRPDQVIVDLVRIPFEGTADYDGLCW
ncbi:MAG: nucleotide sugar dehydrogenase [Gemmatimonadota bacterium]